VNRQVNAIAGRLSLRAPQRQSLEILDRIAEIVPPKKRTDLATALAAIQSEFPSVTDFEREFPSLCFALATGVGKTRLMGAFISYLYTVYGLKNFLVLAPNLTIYNKLIQDFTPNTSKYVFTGIADFATFPPGIITGDDYEQAAGSLEQLFNVKINIFNISKINSEVRGGKAPRIKRLSEYIGESYFDYLAGLDDLVLIMDESHRYRASAGVRAINELKPVLGLELTATPYVETGKGPVRFKNVIYDYPLPSAMEDGFVKEPAVATRKNFNPAGMSAEEIEKLKLEDGIRLHESVKVELETYARQTSNRIVKPFLLVIARDTTHAGQLRQLIESDGFFEGRYKMKVIQVDSSKTGAEEDEMVQRLLAVESTEEPTEIVIHVNMLKEGWDVTNLYTIVPLRAANARILIEQSIGRGLRLPYGKRTGVMAVDRLNIVAHDRFQEIVDEANKPDSPLRLQQTIIDPDQLQQKTVTVVSQTRLAETLGIKPQQVSTSTVVVESKNLPVFKTEQEKKVAQIAWDEIRKLESQPQAVPSVTFLTKPDIQKQLVEKVASLYQPTQLELEAVVETPDIAAIVATTTNMVVGQTIDIPRILVQPHGVRSGFKPFDLELKDWKYAPVSEDLWIQHLRTNEIEIVTTGEAAGREIRLADYVVRGLSNFDDVSYVDHVDLLYDLALQVIKHFRTYLTEEETAKVLRCYEKPIANAIHTQMQKHYFEDAVDYEVKISKGFTELRETSYTATGEPPRNFKEPVADKNNIGKYIFGGFTHCLYAVQKFQSDTERRLAVIIDRESLKWFRPVRGQFLIFYKFGSEQPEYQPDFVAETDTSIYMLESKAKNEMAALEVLAKRDAAVKWCEHATIHAATYDGKPWKYLLIPHDAIADNITLAGLEQNYLVFPEA